ncbi:HAD family hydrolase [Leucobacter sp. W1478]|uniref:HAD family hydrolase n=1 Tax=Leucobacter sp. W1478 TaxID=3439065 RepID=UPI003F2F96B4
MTQHTLAAVLWDMDGTLIDSEPLWLEAELAILERYGIPMTIEIRNRLIGSGLWDAAELFRELGVNLSADDIVAEWVAHVGDGLRRTEPDWRPGATELLASLAAAGIPCALVTMSVRSLAEQVAGLLPAGTFAAIVGGDEVDHAKPHPEPYHRGAAALGVPIEQCLALEDSPTGLRSATSSGAVAIGVPNLVSLDGSHAHALWTTLQGSDAQVLRREFAALRGREPEIQEQASDVMGARA